MWLHISDEPHKLNRCCCLIFYTSFFASCVGKDQISWKILTQESNFLQNPYAGSIFFHQTQWLLSFWMKMHLFSPGAIDFPSRARCFRGSTLFHLFQFFSIFHFGVLLGSCSEQSASFRDFVPSEVPFCTLWAPFLTRLDSHFGNFATCRMPNRDILGAIRP